MFQSGNQPEFTDGAYPVYLSRLIYLFIKGLIIADQDFRDFRT